MWQAAFHEASPEKALKKLIDDTSEFIVGVKTDPTHSETQKKYRVISEVFRHAQMQHGLVTILDAGRGDANEAIEEISHTDITTVVPHAGEDSVYPYLARSFKNAVYVTDRADEAREWNKHGEDRIGLVMDITRSKEIGALRANEKRNNLKPMHVLAPGFGEISSTMTSAMEFVHRAGPNTVYPISRGRFPRPTIRYWRDTINEELGV